MDTSAFPGCCAFEILHDFGGDSFGLKPVPDKEVEDFLLDQEDVFCGGVGALVVTINAKQRAFMVPILIRVGYKLVHTTKNPQHEYGEVDLYVKDVYEWDEGDD